MISFAIFGPLPDDEPSPYCLRGWEPDPQGRMRLVLEVFGGSVIEVRAPVPKRGYEWNEPEPEDKRELPDLVETWTPKGTE